jgi:diguanylate cyclase (GGDEF)-like protein
MKMLAAAFTVAFGTLVWASPPATLTSLSAIHALDNAQASQGLPVDFEATVTYYRGWETTLFVQDGDAGIYVYFPTDMGVIPGDRIRVEGTTLPSFKPFVFANRISVLGHGALPKPVPVTFDQMAHAQTDCLFVTVQGRVHAADILAGTRDSIRLRLRVDGGYINANVDGNDTSALEQLLDADVELVGVAAEEFDSKMQQTGILLHLQSLNDVKILKRAATNPWSLSPTPMDRVLAVTHTQDSTQRVLVHGVITYYQPGKAVVLQDGKKSIWVSTHTRVPLRIGDLADAIGFPEVHDGFLNLAQGEIHDLLIQAPVQPLPTTYQKLTPFGVAASLGNGHHYDLVSIEGRVVAQVREASRDEYVLATDGKLFSAIYRHAGGDVPPAKETPVGSTIRVTGICVQEDSSPYAPDVPFYILLRSFDDIDVIAQPSPLNIRNLVIVVGLLLAGMAIVGSRGWALEHKMRRQSAALSARNKAEAELERRRSHILEDINGSRPLCDILDEIASMSAAVLGGAPCWFEIGDGSRFGDRPQQLNNHRVARADLDSCPNIEAGSFLAAFDPDAPASPRESVTLNDGARLATLAIVTRSLYSDLRHRSEFDQLTELPNRFALEKFMQTKIEEARENEILFGLIYIDLDKFKQINDTWGHQTGDLFLQEVAMRMNRQLLGEDMLARLGGDEFAAVVTLQHRFPDLDRIVARLESCFEDPFLIEGHTLQGAASIGVALFPDDGETREELLRAGDAAMYVVKHTKEPSEV